MICSPSFLSCDFSKLESEIKSISKAKWLHFDVMDGKFVPNTTYDFHMLKLIKQISDQYFDCHLMIEEPEKIYEKYILAGANLLTFHYEATKQPIALMKAIKAKKTKVGISIKPNTDISVLDTLLPDLDLILIMSVEPGKGGQKFLLNSLDKIKYLSEKRKEHNYNYLIEVDGGINFETAKLVKEAGCDVIVVGSFIFNSDSRNDLIMELENV
ncbi:ribulose-phosphate 3-epimerase [Candidatus Izemoplasma sp. B36]|uniref:ribulose-phosphate 3-epimerase n=1 Tax=Candidatus Izemoplasma sp. B36 TaxID=3242468 RepID=UPI003558D4CF